MTTTTTARTAKGGAPAVKKTDDAIENVIDAMRSIQSEQELWALADALAVAVPSGISGFQKIIDEAMQAGVDIRGRINGSTLRIYRDIAKAWKPADRVPDVSFSAHREAKQNSNVQEARKLLMDIAQTKGGGSKVTVASVKRAVAAKTGGKQATTPATPAVVPTAPASTFEAIADLRTGGKKLIAAITTQTDLDNLDEILDGLGKVEAHVTQLRMKAAKKAKAAKATPTPTAPVKGTFSKTGPVAKPEPEPVAEKATPAAKQGDLRDL